MLPITVLLLPPLLATLLTVIVRPYRPLVGWIGVGAAALSLAGAVMQCVVLLGDGALPLASAPAAAWRVDPLSALIALAIAFVTLLTSALAPGLSADDDMDAAQARRLRAYMGGFALTMLIAVSVQNVALMWVAIEATTITSALAIPLRRTKASVEASWKYLFVCSVGIALAFTGTILAYFDFVATAGEIPGALNWSALRGAAPSLHPEILRLAFAFIVVGYGTKAGLAPMHTWLPDAHSEAPSPVSAMMSGVLLAVAMYAIARWKAVMDACAPAVFSNGLLIGFGLASVAIAVLTLVLQKHYKRMLAYSSVEHMGLVAIGLALGPLGMFAAWLHVLNHAVAKSASFLLAGRILRRYRTGEISGVTGLLRAMPWTGTLFAAGILALVGLPPFGLFVSEFLLVQAAFATGRAWLGVVMLVLLLIAFVALLSHVNRMLYGAVPDGVDVGEPARWAVLAMLVPAAIMIVLGIALPTPLAALIHRTVGSLLR